MQSLQVEDTKFMAALRRSFVPLSATNEVRASAGTLLPPSAARVLSKIPHLSVGEALKEARSWW